MNVYTEQLRKLQADIARRKHVQAMQAERLAQREVLAPKVEELDAIRQKEQLDVDRLENGSLKAFFYNVVGKMDEKLTKEREEAYQAAVKYQAAARELEAMDYDLRQYAAELLQLTGCEERYQKVLVETMAAVRAAGGLLAEQVLRKEEGWAAQDDFLREIREAEQAGKGAKKQAEAVLTQLNEAKDLSTWDLVGGGLLVDIMKHDALDEAQAEVEKLQVALGRFKTELADVTIEADVKVNLDSFTKFADCFFDGLFMDLQVRDQIDASLAQIENVKEQINRTLVRLAMLQEETQAQKTVLEREVVELLTRG